MPIKNMFPVFHKLKSGAYSYIWTPVCEELLPQHYKKHCLEYMLREPTPVHWIPDTRKYTFDKYGTRLPVQNHPIHVKYPVQCNEGLWAGEGVVKCFIKKIRNPQKDAFTSRIPKVYKPLVVNRVLYSEILDEWMSIPCTNRAMDLIDEVFGLDNYILMTHERDLNSKLGMDLKRKMILELHKIQRESKDTDRGKKLLKDFGKYMIPEEEAEWLGLSIQEALQKAQEMKKQKPTPLREVYTSQMEEYVRENYNEEGKPLNVAKA